MNRVNSMDQEFERSVAGGISALSKMAKAFFIGAKRICRDIGSHKGVRKLPFGNLTLMLIGVVLFAMVCSLFLETTSFKIAEFFAAKDIWYLKWIDPTNTKQIMKILLILMPMFFVIGLGMKQVNMDESFRRQLEQIGLVAKGKNPKTPNLIQMIEGSDRQIYIFGSSGVPLKSWQLKYPELCQIFNREIHEISHHSGNFNVVKVVILNEESKANQEAELEEKQFYDTVFENARIYPKVTKEVGKNGSIIQLKDYPELLDKMPEGKAIVYRFSSVGTSLEMWKSAKGILENQLKTTILRIENEPGDKQVYRLMTTNQQLKALYPWEDKLIQADDGVIAVGEGYLEAIKIDLKVTNNILIGGTQGSGKSVIMNVITWQMIKKGAVFFGIDFKGGIELGMFADFGPVVSDYDEVLPIVESCIREIKARMAEYKKYRGVKKITDFNNVVAPDEQLARVVICIDEIAEMLDDTGVTGKKKQLLEKIEGHLNTIARLGRAAGVHIISGTQRPDSKVLKGQIKNNLDCRISGRMTDKEPSLMVLGSTAATEIPEDAKGRYMITRGADPVEFQGYLFKEEQIMPGNYVKGRTLVLPAGKRNGRTPPADIQCNTTEDYEDGTEIKTEDDEWTDSDFEEIEVEEWTDSDFAEIEE